MYLDEHAHIRGVPRSHKACEQEKAPETWCGSVPQLGLVEWIRWAPLQAEQIWPSSMSGRLVIRALCLQVESHVESLGGAIVKKEVMVASDRGSQAFI